MQRSKTLLCALLVVAITCAAWRGMLKLALFGWDTFPLIASASEDGWRVVTRELMGGRFPGGHFYRPLTELSLERDHALWGLQAAGYHAMDLALLALSGVVLVLIAVRWLGRERAWWSVLAGAVYVLHAVQFEILPLPPRRAESLAALFTLLALLLVSSARPRRWLIACACAAALASKETGAIAVALVFAYVATRSAEPTWRARCASAWRATWPSFTLVAALLVARTVVLGGLGGGARASVAGNAGELAHVVERYATLVLCPAPPGWLARGSWTLTFAVVLAASVAGALFSSRGEDRDDTDFPPRSAMQFLAIWIALLVGVTAIAGTYRAWYALPFVAPFALLLAFAGALRRSRGMLRHVHWTFAIVALLAFQGWGGGSDTRWREVRASADAAREFLAELDQRIAAAKPGDTLRVDAMPETASTERHGVETRRAMIFAPYSLDAYAALRWPGRVLRFEVARADSGAAAADEVLVLLEPRALDATGD